MSQRLELHVALGQLAVDPLAALDDRHSMRVADALVLAIPTGDHPVEVGILQRLIELDDPTRRRVVLEEFEAPFARLALGQNVSQ